MMAGRLNTLSELALPLLVRNTIIVAMLLSETREGISGARFGLVSG